MSAAPAGPVLALDSSTATGSVAVGDAERLLAEVTLRVEGGHSAVLLPAVDRALASAGLAPRDLGAVVVGGGPGSFTGLRIAAATAKGLVHALGIPLLSYSGLLAAAAGAWGAERPVCALFDARRRNVYAACYRIAGSEGGVEEVFGPLATTLDAVIERFRGGEAPLFVGDGAWAHEEEIRAALGARVAPRHLAAPRAAALLWLAAREPGLGRVADALAWEPEYIQPSGAERIAAAGRTAEVPER